MIAGSCLILPRMSFELDFQLPVSCTNFRYFNTHFSKASYKMQSASTHKLYSYISRRPEKRTRRREVQTNRLLEEGQTVQSQHKLPNIRTMGHGWPLWNPSRISVSTSLKIFLNGQPKFCAPTNRGCGRLMQFAHEAVGRSDHRFPPGFLPLYNQKETYFLKVPFHQVASSPGL